MSTVVNPLTKTEKQTWIKALRSGEYSQGHGVLSRNGRDCCLGVLAEVCDVETDSAIYLRLDHGDDNTWVKLSSEVQAELAGMNDAGVPFEVIAGFIDETL